jgi:prevent-host-death family protein
MALRDPEMRPISDLARNARGLIARARQRQEPIVITQRGRNAAVLVPIELYRQMERRLGPRIVTPSLARPGHAERFKITMIRLDQPVDKADGDEFP